MLLFELDIKEQDEREHGIIDVTAYWKTDAEDWIARECDGYFNHLYPSFTYKFATEKEYNLKVFPEQPPDGMLDYVYDQIMRQAETDEGYYERIGVVKLVQKFKEDKDAWLEFYKRARELHLYVASK